MEDSSELAESLTSERIRSAIKQANMIILRTSLQFAEDDSRQQTLWIGSSS
jgi:hypothetical protein